MAVSEPAAVGLPDWGAPHQDLGHGHTLRLVSEYGGPDDHWCGAIVAHSKPDGSVCVGGYISFEDSVKDNAATRAAGVLWKVESREPLTLSPSLLCRICGDHGWVRAGCWVPA